MFPLIRRSASAAQLQNTREPLASIAFCAMVGFYSYMQDLLHAAVTAHTTVPPAHGAGHTAATLGLKKNKPSPETHNQPS